MILMMSDHKTFANGSSVNIKFSKTQPFKMLQLKRFMYDFLNFPVEPYKIVFDSLNKVEDLAKKM